MASILTSLGRTVLAGFILLLIIILLVIAGPCLPFVGCMSPLG